MRYLFAVLFALTLFAAPIFAADKKPNILFIYVEDLGYYTSERVAREPNARITGLKTPNLDKLAAESVVFTRAFCGQSVCSPSKGAIYSGLLPHANGIWRNVHNATRSSVSRRSGFHCPTRSRRKTTRRTSPSAACTRTCRTSCSGSRRAASHCALSGKLHVQPARNFPYDAFVKTDDLDAVIKAAGDKPWFFWCNPGRHARAVVEARATQAHRSQRTATPRRRMWTPPRSPCRRGCRTRPPARIDLAQYYSCVRNIDEFVGAMLKKLEASGQAERTLVVFTGDHGIGYARGKTSVYPAGTHVPLFIKGPGVKTGTRHRDAGFADGFQSDVPRSVRPRAHREHAREFALADPFRQNRRTARSRAPS